ncbi:MAG: PKD domain-containing protein [Bacteroidia bacterium]|nr:PKD domain-containing protein [Bacteroidia bacterium]
MSFQAVKAQFSINGNSSQTSCNCYEITPDGIALFGSVWNTTMISLNNGFDFTFSVNLGCTDLGADGMAFVLQPINTNQGVGGNGLGYMGISPSLVVEMDTYQNNPYDPANDHIAIIQNGDPDHSTGNTLAGPIQASPSSGNAEDCASHNLRIVWDPATTNFKVYFDGSLRASYTGDIINSIFGGSPNVYWGFTGGTGYYHNQQTMCITLTSNFTFSPATNCAGVPVQFTDASQSNLGSITTWDWDFGDGTPVVSGVSNPTHTFATAGTYNVTLNVNDVGGCGASYTLPITITPGPTVDFTFTPDPACVGSPISFTDASTSSAAAGAINSWDYNFNQNQGLPGIPSTHSNLQNPSFTYNSANTFNVILNVTTTNGCSGTVTKQVSVNPIPFADFTSGFACEGNATQLTDASSVSTGSISTWDWDFGDGTPNQTIQNPTHTFATPGNHSVTLTVATAANCTASNTLDVYVNPSPVANFSANPVCEGNQSIFINNSSPGSGSNIAGFAWDFGDGSAIDSSQNTSHTYLTGNDYTVILQAISDSGCINADTLIYSVYPNPIAVFIAQNSRGDSCLPAIFTFDATASSVASPGTQQNTIVNYFFDFGDGQTNLDTAKIVPHTYNEEGQFSILFIATTNQGCTDTLSQDSLISILPSPIAAFTPAPTELDFVNNTVTITDESSGADSWNYQFGDGGSASVANPFHVYSNTQCYDIVQTVTNTYGCEDTAVRTVCMYPFYSLYVPNTFTPDGDLRNPTFLPKGEGVKEYEIRIFNRWGEEVFKSKSLEYGWDGIVVSTGDFAQQDVYSYVIRTLDFTDKKHTYLGKVNLFR